MRKTARTSVTGAVDRLQTAKIEIEPSTKLTSRELMFFKGIISSREVTQWLPVQIFNATVLAQTLVKLEKVMDEQRTAETLDYTDKGSRLNPVFQASATLAGVVDRYMKLLGFTSGALKLNTSELRSRDVASYHAKSLIEKIKEDDLLA